MKNLITCPTCKTGYETQPDHCDKCGFPFSGTDQEKSVFIGQQILKKSKVTDTKDHIKRAMIWQRIYSPDHPDHLVIF